MKRKGPPYPHTQRAACQIALDFEQAAKDLGNAFDTALDMPLDLPPLDVDLSLDEPDAVRGGK